MPESRRFFIDQMETPLGTAILIAGDDGTLRVHCWENQTQHWRKPFERRYGGSELVARRDQFGHVAALRRYYDGDIAALDTIPVALAGTPFQIKVWNALRNIPGGTTLNYGAVARRIGAAAAVRAVGLANGSNPIGVVVPCHRVIGADGSLTGYGGGLERKRWLLAHEARHCAFRLEASA
jgi:methylated-DNA-[protein]-cysteine S-methyltransferase